MSSIKLKMKNKLNPYKIRQHNYYAIKIKQIYKL